MTTDAKAALKKIFWIFLCAVGVALAIVIILPLFFKNKQTQQSPVHEIIEKTKLEIDKIEIDSKIEEAISKGKEESVIKQIEALKEEPDRKKRLERLSHLLS